MKSKWLRSLAGSLIGISIFYWVFRSYDWREVYHALVQAQRLWVVSAGMILCLQLLLKGFRLMIMSTGIWQLPSAYTQAAVLGLGANSFLPLRAGEVLKIIYMVKRGGAKLLEATLAVIAERLLDVVCLGILLFLMMHFEKNLFLVWLASVKPALASKEKWVLAALGFLVLVTVLGLFLWIADFKGIRGKSLQKIHEAKAKIEEVGRTGVSRLLWSLFLSICIWGADTAFLGWMAIGFDLPIKLTQIFFLQVVLTASYISSVSPGALGIYEALGVWALHSLGVPGPLAIAYLLAAHGLVYLVLSVGTVFVLCRETWLLNTEKLIKSQESVSG